jgi:hypothetical protein
MVVNALHVVSVAFPPNKTDTPLIIDANAVLSLAVAMERFEAIAGRRAKVTELRRGIQLAQLSLRDSLDATPPLDELPLVQALCILRAKALYHCPSL